MRSFLLSAALACALGAVAAAPAAADVFDDRLGEIARGSQHGGYLDRGDRPRISDDERARPRRTRIARAVISDDEDFDYARPRSVRRRDAEPKVPARTSRRPALRRQAAKSHRSSRRASRPSWTRRSLSSAGPRGSGQMGVASYYWQPQRVASGGWFNPNAMTAAHKTLPFGTRVRVRHASNGRSVDVTINDRGPYVAGRVIDLSRAAAGVLGMTAQGIARVTVEILGGGRR